MKSLRERIRTQLADLEMPDSLEALDAVLTGSTADTSALARPSVRF